MKISYKPRLSGLCSIYGAKHREKVAEATANGAFTIVGGGDTIAAAKAFKVADKVSYISTGGGAFLEFLEGKTLPAIAALQERTK